MEMNKYAPGTIGMWARKAYRLLRRWTDPVFPVQQAVVSLGRYPEYWGSWIRYARMPTAEKLRLIDGYPCLGDRTEKTPFDSHYIYQVVWAMEHITQNGDQHHVDVGSDVRFVTMLTTHLPVTFVDIRPLRAKGIEYLANIAGSLLELPFTDMSVKSLSCLHVAEHVGLGRYGDALDPAGTKKAARELTRVLAPSGNLYFSVPVGKPRVCFNAHRIHSPEQILGYFCDLRLVQFSGVKDDGTFAQDLDPSDLADAHYACGLFHFAKEL
jgi:hypothetical protein